MYFDLAQTEHHSLFLALVKPLIAYECVLSQELKAAQVETYKPLTRTNFYLMMSRAHFKV